MKYLKSYGFGEIPSNNCLKQISSNQNFLILQNHFQLDTSNAFSKGIVSKNLNEERNHTVKLFLCPPQK